MVRVERPQVAEAAKPFLTDAELASLLKVTRGTDFEARGEIWWVPIGSRTAAAIGRYLRIRARSRYAESPWPWIGTRSLDVATSAIRNTVDRAGGAQA